MTRVPFGAAAGALVLSLAFGGAVAKAEDRKRREDVVQDACFRALRGFACFREGNIRSWVPTFVRHTRLCLARQDPRPRRISARLRLASGTAELADELNRTLLGWAN